MTSCDDRFPVVERGNVDAVFGGDHRCVGVGAPAASLVAQQRSSPHRGHGIPGVPHRYVAGRPRPCAERVAPPRCVRYGISGLPKQVRDHAVLIGLFYDDLGELVAHRMIDQDLVTGGYGTMIVRLWDWRDLPGAQAGLAAPADPGR
jgi:hypothetical protein